jgi:hypothetical protein
VLLPWTVLVELDRLKSREFCCRFSLTSQRDKTVEIESVTSAQHIIHPAYRCMLLVVCMSICPVLLLLCVCFVPPASCSVLVVVYPTMIRLFVELDRLKSRECGSLGLTADVLQAVGVGVHVNGQLMLMLSWTVAAQCLENTRHVVVRTVTLGVLVASCKLVLLHVCVRQAAQCLRLCILPCRQRRQGWAAEPRPLTISTVLSAKARGGAPKKVSDTMTKNLKQAQGPPPPPKQKSVLCSYM